MFSIVNRSSKAEGSDDGARKQKHSAVCRRAERDKSKGTVVVVRKEEKVV